MDTESLLKELLEVIDDEKGFVEKLKNLTPKETFALQSVFWDYVINAGRKLNNDFGREDIVKKLEPTSKYMYRVGCTYGEEFCRAKICYFTNPNCAARKTKGVIYTLREILLNLTKEAR